MIKIIINDDNNKEDFVMTTLMITVMVINGNSYVD